jgi:Flp pilus assembly protein TadB
MSIGTHIAVIVAGAILTFATHVQVAVISLGTIGAVLMVVGAAGLVLQITSLARQRRLTATQSGPPSEAVLVRPSEAADRARSLPAPTDRDNGSEW